MKDKPPTADEFGYAATARVALKIYETHARATGRTSRLVERLGPNDQIVAPNEAVARFLRHRLAEAGKASVKVFVVRPDNAPMSRVGTAPKGRTFFDHSWVLGFFEHALNTAERELDDYAGAMSRTWPAAPSPLDERARRAQELDAMWPSQIPEKVRP